MQILSGGALLYPRLKKKFPQISFEWNLVNDEAHKTTKHARKDDTMKESQQISQKKLQSFLKKRLQVLELSVTILPLLEGK